MNHRVAVYLYQNSQIWSKLEQIFKPHSYRPRRPACDGYPDRYSCQSEEVQEHSDWESSCQSPTSER